MKLIKAATVYKATIPTDTTTLHNHLAEKPFTDPLALEIRSVGFVPVHEDSCNLVEPFAGGLAFRVRIDEKIIPTSVVNAQVKKRAAAVKEETGRSPGKKERQEIKDQVMAELTAIALVRTVASITCFYQTETGYLIVPTTNQRIADTCTSLLVHAVGSVKTETLNVSDVKHGLTTRMRQWLGEDEDEAFGDFEPCGEAHLESGDKRRITFKMASLASADGLREALEHGYQVKALGLNHDDAVSFTLTEKFKLRGIEYMAEVDTTDSDTVEDLWAADAALQTAAVGGIIGSLCEMLAYKEPEPAAEGSAE